MFPTHLFSLFLFFFFFVVEILVLPLWPLELICLSPMVTIVKIISTPLMRMVVQTLKKCCKTGSEGSTNAQKVGYPPMMKSESEVPPSNGQPTTNEALPHEDEETTGEDAFFLLQQWIVQAYF